MYTNGQPAILASSLSVGSLDLRDPKHPMVICVRCGRWTVLDRSIALAHTNPVTDKPCIGTGQKYRLDVRAAEVNAANRSAAEDATRRRAARTQLKAQPPLSVPVAYWHRTKAPRRAQTAGWTQTQSRTWKTVNTCS